MTWLAQPILGNSVQTWLLAGLTALAVLLAFRLVRRFIVVRVRALSPKTATALDDFIVDLLAHTRTWFLLLLALYAGSRVLVLPSNGDRLVGQGVTIAAFLQAALWGNRAITFGVRRYRREHLDEDAGSVTALSALGLLGRMVLWTLFLLLVLDNLGVEVNSLIAGLGIGGVAVALAVQNILGDLFAALSIVLDKPFVIGDAITVGDLTGTVEKIGLKTTRLQSVDGEQLVFSNSDLLSSRIRNFRYLQERRVVFPLAVPYETSGEQLAQIPAMVQEIVAAQDQVRFDRAHFKTFGDFGPVFEIVYYVLAPDYNLYMDIQQAINLALFRGLAAAGIRFANPTYRLIMPQRE